MGDIALIGQSLGLLHRRGLAEQHTNRFGLPVCKVGGYRQMLLKDLHLAAALRAMAGWLASRDPTTEDSLSAAGAALAIIEWAAERGDWPAVVRLVRVAEPVLMLAGRWEASSHILGQGLEAAKAAGDHAAEALFSHERSMRWSQRPTVQAEPHTRRNGNGGHLDRITPGPNGVPRAFRTGIQ